MRDAVIPDAIAADLTLALHLGDGRAVMAAAGDTLLAALRRATAIRSVCGGRGACGTCRVRVDAAWAGHLPEPARNEARLLRALPGTTAAHRLACQITLEDGSDGLTIEIDSPPTRRLLATNETPSLEKTE